MDDTKEGVWSQIVNFAKSAGGYIIDKFGQVSASVKEWAREKLEYFKNYTAEAAVSAELASGKDAQDDKVADNTVQNSDSDNSINNVDVGSSEETEEELDNTMISPRELSERIPEMMSSVSDVESFRSTQVANMALISVAGRMSVMVDGKDQVAFGELMDKVNSFGEYAEQYEHIMATTSGISRDNALKSLYYKPDYEENSKLYNKIKEEQDGYLKDMETYRDNEYPNYEPLYKAHPLAALAAGDIDYDSYMKYAEDRSSLGMAFITAAQDHSADGKDSFVSSVALDPNDNHYESVDITNLATLRFAKSMAVDQAVDNDALDKKIQALRDHMLNPSLTVDQDIKDMYVTCKQDIDDFRKAESEKLEYASHIPDGSSTKAIMHNFYNSCDPDVAYATGSIDQNTYDKTLSSNVIVLPHESYESYVSSVGEERSVDLTAEFGLTSEQSQDFEDSNEFV